MEHLQYAIYLLKPNETDYIFWCRVTDRCKAESMASNIVNEYYDYGVRLDAIVVEEKVISRW